MSLTSGVPFLSGTPNWLKCWKIMTFIHMFILDLFSSVEITKYNENKIAYNYTSFMPRGKNNCKLQLI